MCLCRYYAAFPSLSDRCDQLAGTCCSSPVEPAWSRIAQTHPKVAKDVKITVVDSGVNSAHDDSPVDDDRPFFGISGSGNLSGNHRQHRKPRRHDDGRRRKQVPRRARSEWGSGEPSVWPTSICGLPWLCSGHDSGHMTYWQLQPTCAGFSQPAMTIAGDWSLPESYKDRFSDLASSEWCHPSYEEQTADLVQASTGILGSNQHGLYMDEAGEIVAPHGTDTAELGNNCVVSSAVGTEPVDTVVSSESRTVRGTSPVVSESSENHSFVSTNDEQVVLVDRLRNDLGNSFSPNNVWLSVLQSGGFGSTLDAEPRPVGSGIVLDNDDPFLGCRPFDPALWSVLNSARMWCADSSLSHQLHFLPRSSECDDLYNVGLHLFEVDSSYDWGDVASVMDCSGCFDASDSFSLLSLQEQKHSSRETSSNNDGLNSEPCLLVNTVDRLKCTETLGNEQIWDGSRIVDAVLDNDAVVTVLDAEAVRQIWQPGSCSGVDGIGSSSCEVDSSTDSTIDCQLSHSHCGVDKTSATGSFMDAEADGHCANEFSDWSSRCHCVSCIWQCELLSADVCRTLHWTTAAAERESNSDTDDENGKHDVSYLSSSASESVFWNEFHHDCGNVRTSLMWESKVFSLDCLGPSSSDCSKPENSKNLADSKVLVSDSVVASDGLFNDLLAVKTRRWFSLLQNEQESVKDPVMADGTEKQELVKAYDSKHKLDESGEGQQQIYDPSSTAEKITGSSAEADETRKFFISSATEVEQFEPLGADADGRDTGLTASASMSSGCDACSSCPPISSVLADLLVKNNNLSSCVPGAATVAGSEEIVQQLPSLGSVSDIIFSDTEDSSDSDLSSSSSVFDLSVFSSPEPCGDEPEASESGPGPGSLTVFDDALDGAFHLNFGSDLCSAAQCYIGSFLAPLYALDGSSLWFRDSHYISANVDALSRLRSGVAPLPTWLPSTSLAHESVCTALARSDHLLPSENTAFRDSIPQRLEPLANLRSVTNALAPLFVHQSSDCPFSSWTSPPHSADESLSVTMMTNCHHFRPIGTPSTTDSDQSETSTATTEAVTTADSLSDFAALVMADMFTDTHGTYQRFVTGHEYDGEDADGGINCPTFQPSFKVQCELEKAAQTGEPSPPISLTASADVQLGCLVKQVLSQLSSEFPEASNNLDDILCDPDDTANEVSCPEEQSADNATVTLSRKLSVIWSDAEDTGVIDPCLPPTSDLMIVSPQVSQIWTDSATTDSSSTSLVTTHGRQLSDIWSDVTVQLADSAYVSDTADLLPSSIPDIWKDADHQSRTKVDRLRRMWRSVDFDDVSAISDGRLFKPQSIWSHSRSNSVTPEVETLQSVLEDGDLSKEGCDPESCSAEDYSDECDVSPSELDIFWGATSDHKSPTTVAGTDAEACVDGRGFYEGGLANSLLSEDNIWSCSETEMCGAECCEDEAATPWTVDPLYCSGNQTSSVIGGDRVLPNPVIDPTLLWTGGEANVDADVAFAFTNLVSGVVRVTISHFSSLP